MGRKTATKKFIDKKAEGVQHFHVVHRSQQDKAVEYDAAASEFVLLESQQTGSGARRKEQSSTPAVREGRDHINSLGLPNDGYDYSQHMREMGGGTFIDRFGGVSSAAAAPLHIPDEALPSEDVLDRHLESITISEKVMDDDMRAIVMGDTEDFEELDDDFVIQAAGDGDDDEQPFDYDEHIRKLLAASERELGLGGRAEEESGDDDGEEDSEGSVLEDEALLREIMSDDRKRIEDEFDAILGDYDSDAWGELDENCRDDEGQGGGKWDVEGNEYLDKCLDDFLESREAFVSSAGGDAHRRVQGDAADLGYASKGKSGGDEEEGEDAHPDSQADDDAWQPIEEAFEYLQPAEREKWDCETIVSTYTTTDNHPTTLSLPRRIGGKGRKPQPQERREQQEIQLSSKTGLPIGVLGRSSAIREEESDNDEYNDDEEGDNVSRVNEGAARNKNETAEEKRRRKAELKEQKRTQREAKKEMKGAFKKGAKDASKMLAHPELAIRRSVYSYA